MDDTTLTNVIQQTKDYDKFKVLEGNRGVTPGHVARIIASIEEHGNMTNATPILVNERMEIVDGQHRFEALKQLDEPIFYTMVTGTGVEDARTMNITQKSWAMRDYAYSWAASGNKLYQKFVNLYEEYQDVVHMGTLLLYTIGRASNIAGYRADFKSGDLADFDEEETRMYLDNLAELQKLDERFKMHSVALGLLELMRLKSYNHEQFVSKIKDSNVIVPRQSFIDNYQHLYEIYTS